MRDLEVVLKAVADPTRLRVLKLLDSGELCVCQIQAVLELAASTVSKHLAILKSAGLAQDRRDGRWIYYSLTANSRNPYAEPVVGVLRGQLDRDVRIREDRRRLKQVQAVPLTELCATRPEVVFRIPPTTRRPAVRPRPDRRPHA